MIYYCTGGCRSGKSAYAQRLAESLGPERIYVATAFVTDKEMRERVRLHQEARGQGWGRLEPCGALWERPAAHITENCPPRGVLLFDCLTLWISGWISGAAKVPGNNEQTVFSDTTRENTQVLTRLRELLETFAARQGHTVIVSNEIGMGIVPATASVRRFRDLAGSANQLAAAASDHAVFLVSGQPLLLKGTLPDLPPV